MDRYSARVQLHGINQRERTINRFKSDIYRKSPEILAYKDVKLNGEPTHIIINSGTHPYYKTFSSLPGQKILAGDYIEWANSTWLIYDADSDDEIYTSGNLRQCQLELHWQKSDGTIVSRYAFIQNASAYNNGVKESSTITLKSNQFMCYLPYDKDTSELDNEKRIHISKKDNVCVPYKLTRPDDVSYGFGEKGVLNIIFTQDQYNPNTDKKVTLPSGKDVWICNYKETTPLPPEPVNDIIIKHKGSSTIVAGGNYKRFYLTDYEGNPLVVKTDWKVTVLPEFEKFVTYEILPDTSIKIKVDYAPSIIGNQIMITATSYRITKSIYIEIGGGI